MEVDNEIFIFGNDTLSHHGIKGQKWGVKKGPPYPLNDRKSISIQKKKRKKELKDKISNRSILSDEEINSLTNRLINEKKLKDAYLNNDSMAKMAQDNKDTIVRTIRDIGSKTILAAGVAIGTATAIYYAAKAASNKDPKLGEAIVKGLGSKKK